MTRRIPHLLLLLLALPANAASPKPEEVLGRTADVYRAMRSYRDQTVKTMSANAQGRPKEAVVRHTCSFARPGRIRLDTGGNRASTVISDGKTLWTYLPGRRQAFRMPAPHYKGQSGSAGGPPGSVLHLLTDEHAKQTLLTGIKNCRIAGQPRIDGHETYLVQFEQPALGTIRMWIGVRDSLVYQTSLEIRPRARPGAVAKGTPARVVTTTVHKQIEVNPRLPDTLFRFVPPAGVKVVTPSAVAHPARKR